MQRILLKRTLRDLKTNLLRYLALFLLIALCMFIVIGIVGSAQSVIKTVNNHAEQNHLEDGQFGVFMPLSEQDIASIMREEKAQTRDTGKVTLPAKEIEQFFPKSYTPAQKKKVIVKLLASWARQRGEQVR